MSHILVDFDRTLARYESWSNQGKKLGEPIPAMVERVKAWLAEGKEVRIFTARACKSNPQRDEDILNIQEWCVKHIGRILRVQNWKNFETTAIWDDLAVGVVPNEGAIRGL